MRRITGKIAIISILLASIIATAADNLPLISNEPAKLDAFFQKTVEENPWMAGTQIPNSMANFRAVEQRFLPGLLQNPQYQALAPKRGEFVTLHIEREKEALVRVPVLTPQTLQRIKQETIRTFRTVAGEPGQNLTQALNEAIRVRLDALTHSDPRGILTGLINCLPREIRAPYFQIQNLERLLEQIINEPLLTDEAVKGGFRGEAHHIGPEKISRDYVLAHVGEQIQREAEVVQFLQARWFLERAEAGIIRAAGSIEQLEKLIEGSGSDAFDINDAEEETAETFFREILALAPEAKDLRRKAQNYLNRVEQQWRDAERVFEERKEKTGEPYLTVRELPAYIVSHRGVLTGDCGTRDDYALVFAPLERNFFVFDAQGKVTGYVGATYINTNNQYTFYIHDITGHGVSQATRDIIANAFYVVRKQFGTEVMTLGITGYAPYSYPSNQNVVNQYLDAEVRNYLAPFCANPHGDRPADNPSSMLFNPNQATLKGLLVRLEGQAAPRAPQKAPESRKEKFTQFLDLTAGGANMNVPLQFLGIGPDELQEMAATLRNDDGQRLELHYQRLNQLFAAYDTPLSEKFLSRHEAYFVRGHLNAEDALTTQDPKYRERSISFVLATIRRGQDRDIAYSTIAANPEFFANSEKFQTYLSELPLNYAENLVRLERLIQAGMPASAIAPRDARLQELTEVANIHMQTWAIAQWIGRGNRASPTMIQTLGQALKNDKHETDDTSLLASKLLAENRSDDAEVNKSLGKSLSREENEEIAFHAGLALLRNGLPLAEIRKLISKSKIHDQLTKALQASGELPPPGADEAICADEVNRQAPK